MGFELAIVGKGISVSEHVRFDATGLDIREDTTPEELRLLAQRFNLLQDASCFAIGDLANHYRAHYVGDWREWIDSLPKQSKDRGTLDQKTVLVYAAVCAAYPDKAFRARFLTAENGRRPLSFAHFSRVRRYGPAEQEYWLERAAVERLSVEQMEQRIEGSMVAADVVPPVPEIPESRFGETYWLGPPNDPTRHLLLCGDATVPNHLALLLQMGAGRGTLLWTDPPYGVGYVGKTSDELTIEHDVGGKRLDDLLRGAWEAVRPVLVESAPFYVAGPTGYNAAQFLRSFEAANWRFQQLLVWVKHNHVLGHHDYHLQHEGVYHGYLPGPPAGRMAAARSRWYGDDDAVSVFMVDRPSASRLHPTMKPVKLVVPMVRNSSRPGEIVLDPFAGSGTTLIAADMNGRRCFAVEYDPAYVDVIKRRYADYLVAREEGLIPTEADASADVDYGPSVLEER